MVFPYIFVSGFASAVALLGVQKVFFMVEVGSFDVCDKAVGEGSGASLPSIVL